MSGHVSLATSFKIYRQRCNSSQCQLNKEIQMRLTLLLIIVIFATCKKPVQSNDCPETGTIKKGGMLGLWCKEASFIVKADNSIIQPVITNNLLNGFSEGDKITFGYREVFLGM